MNCSARLALQSVNLNGGRLFHRAVILTARPSGIQVTVFAVRPMRIRITLLATQQEPAPLEEPSATKIGGPMTAGPALPRPHHRRTHDTRSVPCLPSRNRGNVAQGSLSSPSADGRLFHRAVISTAWHGCSQEPIRRGAKPKVHCPVCGAARARTAGRAAGPDRGPCATRGLGGVGAVRGPEQ